MRLSIVLGLFRDKNLIRGFLVLKGETLLSKFVYDPDVYLVASVDGAQLLTTRVWEGTSDPEFNEYFDALVVYCSTL